jgi:hypothetical protein
MGEMVGWVPKGDKGSQVGAKWTQKEPKGAKGSQKKGQREPKGTTTEPKGAKGSQMELKVHGYINEKKYSINNQAMFIHLQRIKSISKKN